MPYSDRPPTAVYPDTWAGICDHQKACRKQGMRIPVGYCSEYKEDPDPVSKAQYGIWCANRDSSGDRAHNWCFKCPAGYIFWLDERDTIDPYEDETRERASVISW